MFCDGQAAAAAAARDDDPGSIIMTDDLVGGDCAPAPVSIAPASLDIPLPCMFTAKDVPAPLSRKEMQANLMTLFKQVAAIACGDARLYAQVMQSAQDELARLEVEHGRVIVSGAPSPRGVRKARPSSVEGQPKKPRKATTCGVCKREGHNKQTCLVNKQQLRLQQQQQQAEQQQ